MRVLIWNLFHGRAKPSAGRSLLHEFSTAIASWSWDVALLQEVPPWWPPQLARAAGAAERTALTSRNLALPLRRLVADRRPDLIKSNGGGSNVILVRAGNDIAEHRVCRLRWLPERRVMHAIALRDGPWLGNLHAQAHAPRWARADLERAVAALRSWAGDRPALLGGDFNDRTPHAEGFDWVVGHDVDHVLLRGLRAVSPAQVLDAGALSDHKPVLFEVASS
jgi:endonuclease/exonuclease/phosphatase family metal-dependent hydrolase